MNHEAEVFFGLFVVFAAAQVGAEVAQRLRLPALVGEIAAGCMIGPSVLGWVYVSEPLEMLSGLGAVLLLYSVGLENRVGDLRKVGGSATLVGLLGVIVPFVLGAAWAKWSGVRYAEGLVHCGRFCGNVGGGHGSGAARARRIGSNFQPDYSGRGSHRRYFSDVAGWGRLGYSRGRCY